jgi:glutamate synthase (NADPH/NADH) large chain
VPAATGLFDPSFDKDSCGFALVATMRGSAGHDIIDVALDALRNLEHRGAVGSDAGTGDGAGIMTQIPHEFLISVAGFPLPESGAYAVGNAFLPVDRATRETVVAALERIAHGVDCGLVGQVLITPTEPAGGGNRTRLGDAGEIKSKGGRQSLGHVVDRRAWRSRIGGTVLV